MSYKAFAEFFAVRMTLATFVAHTFAALRALALPGFAVVSFNALAIFFAIAVTLAHVPGQGAAFAAPVARQVMEQLLRD